MFNLYYNAFNKELMNIILLGYMGVGKSLIGQHLSKILNQKFIDLDEYIATKKSKSIHDIFKDSGDIYFRKIESQLLNDCLLNNANIILSVGGGTPCYNNNMSLINSNENISVYLKNRNVELAKRLFQIKEYRPLISDIESEEKMIEFVSKHMLERINYYNMAKFHVTYDLNDKMDACKKIIGILNKNGL